MRKIRVFLALAAGSVFLAGCQKELSTQKSEDYIGNVVNDIKAQAAEDLKKAFTSEIEEFFQNDDLSTTLGLSSSDQEKIQKSIKKYIDDFSRDEEKLSEAKESLENLIKNAEGLSPDELQNKIEGIFKE